MQNLACFDILLLLKERISLIIGAELCLVILKIPYMDYKKLNGIAMGLARITKAILRNEERAKLAYSVKTLEDISTPFWQSLQNGVGISSKGAIHHVSRNIRSI